MALIKKYRYPGIKSFETEDADIFFGREDDRKKLADLVGVEKTVLLYSKSGLGKSSLLNAALIPELNDRGYQVYYLRLGLYQENSLPPVQHVFRKTILHEMGSIPVTFLDHFVNRSNTLWFAFKSLQLAQQPNDKPIVLIFDQFEEIGSYPEKQLHAFKQQLAELLYTAIPREYLDGLRDKFLLSRPLTEAEMDLLYKPLRVKSVFAIRSDQMSVVNDLSDYLPNVLKVFYELRPLTKSKALKAIVDPARKAGDFITPKFSYQEDALNTIITALTTEKSEDIDTAQLQILLQFIEQDIVEKKNDTDISAKDLGSLKKVYENYYNNSLGKLKQQREKAQLLIEEKLIVEGRRISYDRVLCLQLVSQTTLDELIETRLIRQEPNTMGGYSYEVSHDSLIAPIMEARLERVRKEDEAARVAQEKAKYEARLAEEKEKADKQRKIELEEEARKREKYEAELDYRRKRQKMQRSMLIAVFILMLFSVSLAIYAFKSRKEAKVSELQAREALRNFISAEIGRKQMEINQLKSDIRVFRESNDSILVEAARLQVDSMTRAIETLKR